MYVVAKSLMEDMPAWSCLAILLARPMSEENTLEPRPNGQSLASFTACTGSTWQQSDADDEVHTQNSPRNWQGSQVSARHGKFSTGRTPNTDGFKNEDPRGKSIRIVQVLRGVDTPPGHP